MASKSIVGNWYIEVMQQPFMGKRLEITIIQIYFNYHQFNSQTCWTKSTKRSSLQAAHKHSPLHYLPNQTFRLKCRRENTCKPEIFKREKNLKFYSGWNLHNNFQAKKRTQESLRVWKIKVSFFLRSFLCCACTETDKFTHEKFHFYSRFIFHHITLHSYSTKYWLREKIQNKIKY